MSDDCGIEKLHFLFCVLIRNRQVNHARNVFDRAVTILPRANQFWYKYTYMEEMLGNVAGDNLGISFNSCHLTSFSLFVFQGGDKCLSAGWNGNPRSSPGMLTLILNSATRNWTGREPFMNDISFFNAYLMKF